MADVQFDWLVNQVETAHAGKETTTALQSRIAAVEPTLAALESDYALLATTFRSLEGFGAFTMFQVELDRLFDTKESTTALNLRVAAAAPRLDDLTSRLNEAAVEIRAAEQALLDYLTEELTP